MVNMGPRFYGPLYEDIFRYSVFKWIFASFGKNLAENVNLSVKRNVKVQLFISSRETYISIVRIFMISVKFFQS